MLKHKIKELAEKYHGDIVEVRRHLHRFPELSFKETATAKYISDKLSEYNIPHESGWAKTGIAGMIKGKNPEKKTIALRADIDALPIQENSDKPYRSANDGVMHACGHDVHTASLLGAARILNDLRQEFEGSIRLIFQPGEEQLPGGASILIQEGILENPVPEMIFGQHVHPPLASGKVGFKPGKYMASADEIHMTVIGKGGHGALPYDCIDPVLIAAHIITGLQQIVSRNANPTIPSVLTFGKINSTGGATNVIPNEVKILGTFRTMNEEWREEAHQRMTRMAIGIAESMGGRCDFRLDKGYPFLVNDEPLTLKAMELAREFLGEGQVVELPIRMTAEDFAFYSQKLPACFYRLGTGNESLGITSSIHTDTFDIDENSLLTGMGLMAWLACKSLPKEE